MTQEADPARSRVSTAEQPAKMGRSKQKQLPCAMFVHAGAGYHSRENEGKHLLVCSQATKAGLAALQAGGTAVEAVEIAIMILEDNPITNAGYGSNLTAKGVVECDASIMDHLGRSGAAGAVPNVKNPIMLARKIYDEAYRSPGMSRVPPNFLVGGGATDFAWTHNIPNVPDDALITAPARERWNIWTREIQEYEAENSPDEKEAMNPWLRRPLPPMSSSMAVCTPPALDKLEAGIFPTSQLSSDNDLDRIMSGTTMDGQFPRVKSQSAEERTSFFKSGPSFYPKKNFTDDEDGEDHITDTVGAIAIDRWGNIAAGSSSGGIGMKHRGRVGPAALIGIGTHVMPVDPSDPERTTTAVVTSGTGEHISSTFAASTCASRIYYGQKMGSAGVFVQVPEEEAIHAMIENEFMNHPAVQNSEVGGSIGILAVKKTDDGIGLFFAHNTESFAVGSMAAGDVEPLTVMSRSRRNGVIAQGGIMIRSRKPSNDTREKKRHKIAQD